MSHSHTHGDVEPVAAFEQIFPVLASDIDEHGHVNNVVYLRWVQDVAVAHWRHAATPEQQACITWIVLRHEIDYTHPARSGDQVVARTWVGTASRVRFERHTELQRVGDRRVLARARTLWCPISTETGRPTNVDAEVRARFSVPA